MWQTAIIGHRCSLVNHSFQLKPRLRLGAQPGFSHKSRHGHKADVGNAVQNVAHGAAENLRLDAHPAKLVRGLAEFLDHILLLVVRHNGFVPGDHFPGKNMSYKMQIMYQLQGILP